MFHQTVCFAANLLHDMLLCRTVGCSTVSFAAYSFAAIALQPKCSFAATLLHSKKHGFAANLRLGLQQALLCSNQVAILALQQNYHYCFAASWRFHHASAMIDRNKNMEHVSYQYSSLNIRCNTHQDNTVIILITYNSSNSSHHQLHNIIFCWAWLVIR